ncbi:hypothetical protein [Nocardioides rubriscoriae]|uniref:hypothetical protein n=1 Tax=Nocardioides rubriscoriae TaxID=642762 RepID=UPI001478D042|nr:hypothetical protein [Nocardioides rubriscoriae]
MPVLVLVTGSGRSGTSSIAGALKRLGHHVPQPEKQADESNPRGYYESSWVAAFHARWFKALRVRAIDTRPDAGRIVMDDLDEGREQRLATWLRGQLATRADDDVIVIKDPRAFWVLPLWRRTARATGCDLVSLTMLRHPSQVVRSSDAAYLTERPDAVRLQRESTNVAAWVNALLVAELETRDNPRAFVRYVDLVADWRTAVGGALAHLGLDPGDLTAPHPIDDFITPALNRAADSWDGLAVPRSLRELADRAWQAAQALVEHPYDPATSASFDALRHEYDELHTASQAIAADACDARVRDVRTRLRQRLEERDAEIARLRQELDVRPGRPRA